MAKQGKIRFGVGSAVEPYSGIWRLVSYLDDVYLGASKASMGAVKMSLHQSGVWTVACNQQSGGHFNGNRRAKQWQRPAEHAPGVTRGPSIYVPYTSLGCRRLPPGERGAADDILWHEAPTRGRMVEFSLYFVRPGPSTQWNGEANNELASVPLSNGQSVVLCAADCPLPEDLAADLERQLAETIVQADGPQEVFGSYLWFTESRDELRIPLVFDLPVPVPRRPNG